MNVKIGHVTMLARWWLGLLLFLPCRSEAAILNVEQELLNFLLTNYSSQARPVLRQSDAINVTFGIELVQLISVDDRSQFINTKVWVRQQWRNELLMWDPSEWEGISSAQLDASLLWVPDIVLYNNADDSFAGGTEKYKTRISITASGMHYWFSPALFRSTCSIDIRYFPFDKQVCKLKFGSWAFDKSGLDMLVDPRPLITSQYVNSSEWRIQEARAVREEFIYACCPNPYVVINFEFVLYRKPLYYFYNVIFPCLVLISMILLGFFLPPESGERISLTMTILLAMAFFLQFISDALPKNSDSVPVLALFYMVIISETAVSLVTTCAVLAIHHKSEDKGGRLMPSWVRKVFLGILARRLGLYYAGLKEPHVRDATALHFDTGGVLLNGGYERKYGVGNGDAASIGEVVCNGVSHHELSLRRQSVLLLSDTSPHTRRKEETLNSILEEVKGISQSMKHNQGNDWSREDWRMLAKVLDRLFFFIFVVTVSVSSICVLIPIYVKNN